MTAHKGRPAKPRNVRASAQSSDQTYQIGVWVVAAAVLIYGIYQVIQLSWVCDDAFISFRYAKNFVNGLGLVFNAGERVEGYTNFLWTIIIAAGMWLKLDPLGLSEILGALSFFVTVGLFGWLSHRLFSSGATGSRLFLPLTAMAMLLHHDCQVFATSGLETSFDMMLVSFGFAFLVFSDSPRNHLLAGLMLILAAAARPDSMAFYVIGGVFVLVATRPPWKSLLYYALPLVVLYLPYWIIRYNYYGWPFPNTYYAKSADLPYYSQGWIYLSLYFRSYYVLMLAPLAVIGALISRRKRLVSYPVSDPSARALLLILLFSLPYLFYVLRSGGDFMFARFFIPITPLILLALEISLRMILPRVKLLVPAALVILALVVLRWNPFSTDRMTDFVADEPQFYPASYIQHAQEVGGIMKRAFAGTNARIAFRGQYAMYAYYSEAPTAIEAHTGLTDERLAHQPITKRGRPGHEKTATPEYLRERKVNFLVYGGLTPKYDIDSITSIQFGDYQSHILLFDNSLMDHLKKFPDVQFTDIRDVLDGMIAQLKVKSDTTMLDSYPFLKAYYFNINRDPEREKWFLTPPNG